MKEPICIACDITEQIGELAFHVDPTFSIVAEQGCPFCNMSVPLFLIPSNWMEIPFRRTLNQIPGSDKDALLIGQFSLSTRTLYTSPELSTVSMARPWPSYLYIVNSSGPSHLMCRN